MILDKPIMRNYSGSYSVSLVYIIFSTTPRENHQFVKNYSIGEFDFPLGDMEMKI